MAFDSLAPGVRPVDCEPDQNEPDQDPDRHYEARVEREMEGF